MTIATLFLADFFNRSSLYMLAGFIMLGWVLARRSVFRRKRMNKEARESRHAMKKLAKRQEAAVPLSDAPVETQRWQIAMFDMQRELRAELDTRIAIVQSLVTKADERIAELRQLESRHAVAGQGQSTSGQIIRLSQDGYSATEIAHQLDLPVGEVELQLAMNPV